ncbi:putative cobalamin binding protein [Desulfosporosinus orientis DSM 765]|uniref:Putative cobalamin binding protein n=1 Tax=Desulfosporosinus orientis (strain ATCC 19365 / DSM 765 / NCIMB 8382 / VKM B-1628 / Singapore I) TaxID=768706 RepID=G7WAP5_DESOD|nr:corrinoid protein [Desulfosporosinus orientis]AET66813.1 putative cobalamin binding protein [Desulfosporosinus orientis DSM 765]
MASFESLAQNVVAGKEAQVKEQVQELINAGTEPLEIINQGLIAGMNIVGPRFKAGDMFVPEVLMAAKAMASGIALVKPLMTDNDLPSMGTVVLGTVKGDLHDIGKNLVGMLLESGGFKVINLGIDIAPEGFVQSVKEHKADIVAMSALLTTTMLGMKDTIELMKEEGLNVKCIIGGAPISKDYANEIGADGFAPDAASAVDLCKELLSA